MFNQACKNSIQLERVCFRVSPNTTYWWICKNPAKMEPFYSGIRCCLFFLEYALSMISIFYIMSSFAKKLFNAYETDPLYQKGLSFHAHLPYSTPWYSFWKQALNLLHIHPQCLHDPLKHDITITVSSDLLVSTQYICLIRNIIYSIGQY